jgi:hypothetical protein
LVPNGANPPPPPPPLSPLLGEDNMWLYLRYYLGYFVTYEVIASETLTGVNGTWLDHIMYRSPLNLAENKILFQREYQK